MEYFYSCISSVFLYRHHIVSWENSAALLFFYCKRGLGPAPLRYRDFARCCFCSDDVSSFCESADVSKAKKMCLSAILESLVGFDAGKNIEAWLSIV